jgi:hypothetical protein
MDLKKKLLLGLLVASLALTAVAGISFAAGGTGAKSAPPGITGGSCGVFGSLSDALGLTPEQIIAKRNKGESLANIAKDQNVSQEALVSAIIADRKKILDQRVKAGTITAGDEQLLLDQMKARVRAGINHKFGGPGAGVGNSAKGSTIGSTKTTVSGTI